MSQTEQRLLPQSLKTFSVDKRKAQLDLLFATVMVSLGVLSWITRLTEQGAFGYGHLQQLLTHLKIISTTMEYFQHSIPDFAWIGAIAGATLYILGSLSEARNTFLIQVRGKDLQKKLVDSEISITSLALLFTLIFYIFYMTHEFSQCRGVVEGTCQIDDFRAYTEAFLSVLTYTISSRTFLFLSAIHHTQKTLSKESSTLVLP
ncbi:MAG: hypothetical protein HZA34_03590 [Candidatus Pacebacteria bacterium]|nr:hypothetical protein [Candidatus Paceibacterota bacterium]